MIWECKRCGGCCGRLLPLTKQEQIKLKNIIKEQQLKPNNLSNVLIVKPQFNNDCPFLGNNKECIIYADRPKICRDYKCNGNANIFDTLGKTYNTIDINTLFKEVDNGSTEPKGLVE
jgi:Fe-S-cluster containining protein